ncbi:MAG: cation-translocating P-type ATPase, partial [Promethearchaeota archaeon]
KRLNAAETLGSVTVIATDKTGTLTENKMKVAKIYSDSKLEDLNLENLSNNQEEILKIGILVNNLNIKEDNGALQYIGDPMEIALVKAANNAKIPIKKIKNEYNLHYEFSFDNHRRMMSQIYSINNHFILYTKGAPENLLNKTSTLLIDDEEITMTEILKQDIMKIVNQLAIQGLRILGFAKRRLARVERNLDDVENNLNFIGLIGFIDPPRKEVSSAIKACQNAGIRIIMITGDYELTAKNIAENVGIEHKHVITGTQIEKMDENELKNVVMETSIFSRATPEHKLQIVNALKSNGEIVAVTGDGINDAPALKRADIGIAMGETGTDVARETADMVLIDDNFTTIEIAIEQGRKLYDNLKKGVRYYLAVKLALILIFLTPIIFNVPLPFAPIQIILLELFMDLAASTTFVIEPTESYAMKIKARSPNEKFINLKMRVDIIIGGISLGIAVLLIYLITYFQGFPQARSIAFATWMVGHIFLAINMRTNRDTLYQIGFFSNKIILLWAIGVFAVLFSIIYIPSLQFVFKLSPLNIFDWLYIFLVAFIFTFWIEFIKNIKRK